MKISKLPPYKEDIDLWKTIKDYQFDEPGTETTFAEKLSIQHNWSKELTHKAIEEYKKFVYLCCISANDTSPSHLVDRVWHHHLNYPRSFWVNLNKKLLKSWRHRHSYNGRMHRQHRVWYENTLELYLLVFKQLPDERIWPRPETSPEIQYSPDFFPGKMQVIIFNLLLALPTITCVLV